MQTTSYHNFAVSLFSCCIHATSCCKLQLFHPKPLSLSTRFGRRPPAAAACPHPPLPHKPCTGKKRNRPHLSSSSRAGALSSSTPFLCCIASSAQASPTSPVQSLSGAPNPSHIEPHLSRSGSLVPLLVFLLQLSSSFRHVWWRQVPEASPVEPPSMEAPPA